LATLANVNAAKVRKDLSFLGSHGVRGVGYDTADLQREIRSALGLTRDFPAVIIGVGNLGSALANYDGFAAAGFCLVGIYDIDESKIGTIVGGQEVRHIEQLEKDVAENHVDIGMVATPASAAQEAAERLAAAGVGSILNFAPTVLRVPDVAVRRVDLSTELQILGYYSQADRFE
jgi:redox-sensing transcriptional repressor